MVIMFIQLTMDLMPTPMMDSTQSMFDLIIGTHQRIEYISNVIRLVSESSIMTCPWLALKIHHDWPQTPSIPFWSWIWYFFRINGSTKCSNTDLVRVACQWFSLNVIVSVAPFLFLFVVIINMILSHFLDLRQLN